MKTLLFCAVCAACVLFGCDDTRYNNSTVDTGLPTADLDAVSNGAMDVGAEADVPYVIPDGARLCEDLQTCGFYGLCVDDEASGERCFCHEGFVLEEPWCVPSARVDCVGSGGWTASVPEGVERLRSKVFSAQSASPYGAVVAYIPDNMFSGAESLMFWFPSSDGEHRLISERVFTNEASVIDLEPMEGSVFAGQYYAVGTSFEGRCSALQLSMGVVEAFPGAWPILNTTFQEMLAVGGLEGLLPDDSPDRLARCTFQGIDLVHDGARFRVFVSLYLETGESLMLEVSVSVDLQVEDVRLLGRFGGSDDSGELESVTRLSASPLSGVMHLSAVQSDQFASWIVTTPVDGEVVWTRVPLGSNPRGLLNQVSTRFEHRLDTGEMRHHLFVRNRDGSVSMHSMVGGIWADVGHVPELAGNPSSRFVGDRSLWIYPDREAFLFTSFERQNGDNGHRFQQANIGLPGGALSGGSYRTVASVDDRIGNLEAFQVVYNDEGVASMYYEEVQQGAAERISVGGLFTFDFAAECR